MKYAMIFVLLVFSQCFSASGQNRKERKLRESQRKQFELSNYFISMNINALLTVYTGLIEYRLDSIMANESSPDLRNHQLFLKSTLISSISEAAFHSDPLAAAIDSWAQCYQLEAYFRTEACADEYGSACRPMELLFRSYAHNYENGLRTYIKEDDRNSIRQFAANYPIADKYLNRRSIIYELSAWISEEELRLKSGLLNMNDLMRDMANQLEYFAAVIPKQTMWQLDMRLGEFVAQDSLSYLMGDLGRVLKASAGLLEQSEEMLRTSRDTVLSSIDYQRRVSLDMLRRERIASMETLSMERAIVLDALRQERQELQEFMAEQREAVTSDMTSLSGEMMDRSVFIGKEMVDYVFFRALILMGLTGIFILVAIWAFKRL